LGYGGLIDFRCHRCAHETGKPDDGERSRATHDDPDSHKGSHSGIYFHGLSVALHRRRVLIERLTDSLRQPMESTCPCGCPLQIYVDYHSLFFIHDPDAVGGEFVFKQRLATRISRGSGLAIRNA
jgi:hypothetical protein